MSRICTLAFAIMAMTTLELCQAQNRAQPRSSAPAAASARVPAPPVKRSDSAARANLDLHAPPLNHIMPSAQLRYILASPDADAELPVEVSVKGTKTVVVPGSPGNQLQAIPWAIFHPTQAWRIFTPLEQP